MRHLILSFLLIFSISFSHGQKTEKVSFSEKIADMKAYPGYFDFYWEKDSGKIWLKIDKIETEFLYVNSLTSGIGSNDIGLDRNQLGNSRVVKFIRSGPKVLLIQPNYDYRAISKNPEERRSVEEAFAQSILGGFKIIAEEEGKLLVDFTSFLLRDAHGAVNRLKRLKQGTYKADASRSAVYLPGTKNFPKNSEFEAILTFSGEAKGEWIRSVTPSSDAITVKQHHSFIELPDDNYQNRTFDPRCGFFPLTYSDYATPIDQPLKKHLIHRHRLKKKNPNARMSAPVEPIIYYVDRGAPEPVKSALIEGASWWNGAFEAAGYKNAFQVKVLPENADPMDVRYNVINWVHRSTRGWSYGSTVTDPRTGEIIKGHVLLGSLRVRQDFLIAQGLIQGYENGKDPDPRLLQMALARLRQLSAHEVGHTLGLAHNFTSSYNNRASVMDYPHPFVLLKEDGELDFSQAYDTGIGDWDKRTILYGYQDFLESADEKKALSDILKENSEKGFLYISDADARPQGGAHPHAHLWDNGQSSVQELQRLMQLRKNALKNFSEKNIPDGLPMAWLENVLTPLYLSHRYQVEAVAKLIGGVHYSYTVKGDVSTTQKKVDKKTQREALDILFETLHPKFLALSEEVTNLIPPRPPGYSRDREIFKTYTAPAFDPLAAAESSASHTISFLLNPQRLARILEQYARDQSRISLYGLMDELSSAVRVKRTYTSFEKELARMTEKLFLHQLLQLAGDKTIMQQIAATALLKLDELEKRLKQKTTFIEEPSQSAHYLYMLEQIRQFKNNPSEYKVPKTPAMPDGAPIGCGW